MEGQSFRGMESTSPSRLSPSAPPFTMDRSNSQIMPNSLSSVPFSTSVSVRNSSIDDWQYVSSSGCGFETVSLNNLKDDSVFDDPLGAYAVYGTKPDVPIGGCLNKIKEKAHFAEYSSNVSQSCGDSGKVKEPVFNIMPSIQPQYARYPFGMGYTCSDSTSGNVFLSGDSGRKADDQRSFGWKENNEQSSSLALTEQGKHANEGLKPLRNTNMLRMESFNILEKEKVVGFRGMEKPDTECVSALGENFRLNPFMVSTSSPFSEAAVKNDSQCSLPNPALTPGLSKSDINVAFSDRHLSQTISFTIPPAVSLSSGDNRILSHISHSSDASKTYSSFDSNPSASIHSSFCRAANNNGHSSAYASSLSMYDIVPNLKGKVHCEKSLELKGNERQDAKAAAVLNDHVGTSVMVKPELKITCSSLLPHKPHQEPIFGGRASISREKPSVASDSDDSDVDSPCWKGTQAAVKSPSGVSSPVTSEVSKNELKRCKSLNPQAPAFFPGCFKPSENHLMIATSTETLLTQECSSIKNSVKAELRPPEVPLVSGAQGSSAITELKEPHVISCPSKESLPKETNVGESEKVIEGTTGDASTSAHFFGIEQASCSLSPRLGISCGLSENVRHVFKLLSMNSKLDVRTVINAMHILSEFLMQDCSSELKAMKRSEHDLIQGIIRNLSSCVENRVAETSQLAEAKSPSSSDSSMKTLAEAKSPSSSYSSMKTTDHPKNSIIEFQGTRKQTILVPNEFNRQSGTHGCRSVMVGRKVFDFRSGNDAGFDKGIVITKAVENPLPNPQQTEEKMDPQALLYRNLWLESEAELRRMKYKACAAVMKAEMD